MATSISAATAASLLSHTSFEKMSETAARWGDLVNRRGKVVKPGKMKWAVTEKVHGANFCFHTDGKTVQCAKRRSILANEDIFFGHKSVADKYSNSILDIFKIIQNGKISNKYIDKSSSLRQISVYGELFGGFYPNASDKSGKAGRSEMKSGNDNTEQFVVQREIFYSPTIDFYAFDIAIVSADDNRDYMDFEDCISLFEESGLFYAKPLKIDKFEKCADFNLNFETFIPKWLGLDKIQGIDNLAEGIVIKPMQTLYVSDSKKGGKDRKVRAMVKRKHSAFREMVSQSNKTASTTDGKLDQNEMNIEYIVGMINQNRYLSVYSKIGNDKKVKLVNHSKRKPGKKQKNHEADENNEYVKEMVDDVINDITQETGTVEMSNDICLWWSNVVAKDEQLRRKIKKRMTQKAIKIVSNNK